MTRTVVPNSSGARPVPDRGDAAGDDERIGSQPDRRVQRSGDEEHRREQPRPGVAVEPEPVLRGVFGGADHQRPEHGAERRGEHDAAHRPAAFVGLGEVGRRVAGEEVGGLPVPEHEQADEEQRQRLRLDTDRGDQPAGGRRRVAEHHPGPAAAALHPSRQHLRHQGGAHRDRRRRGAGPRCVLTEDVLDHERADRDRTRQRGGADDLARRQGAQGAALQLGPRRRVERRVGSERRPVGHRHGVDECVIGGGPGTRTRTSRRPPSRHTRLDVGNNHDISFHCSMEHEKIGGCQRPICTTPWPASAKR